MDVLWELWTSLGAPNQVEWIARVKWLAATFFVFVIAGLWIGQLALSGLRAYYPAERFRLALAWSLLVYALFLGTMLIAGWYFRGQTSWGAVAVHISLVVFALTVAVLLTPAKWRAPHGRAHG